MADLAQAISRAARAKSLLNDDLLREALFALEANYIDHWRVTKATDTDARERLWLAVQVVGKVRDHLKHVVDDGKIAQAEMDALLGKAA